MAADWECHKETIRNLYLSRDMSLQDVMVLMKEKHAFEKSKGQYERQLKKWSFTKNNAVEEWKIIGGKIDKRPKGCKATAVYKNGRLVPKAKLGKAIRRYFPAPMEVYKPAPTPKTPEGFVVCTPLALDPPSILMNNLPLFRFQGHLRSLGTFIEEI
ncbi:hypothetical protein LTR85_005830 [Meristemomyces frigidus]|nr:hypothetical protein LTR85_005830 [Meristemomyces frigidus]